MQAINLLHKQFGYLTRSIWMAQRRKWAYLENLSTTTKMQLLPPDLGSPSTKFIEIICQDAVGTAKRCNKHGYRTRLGFAC